MGFTLFMSCLSRITGSLVAWCTVPWKPLFHIFCPRFGCFQWECKNGTCYSVQFRTIISLGIWNPFLHMGWSAYLFWFLFFTPSKLFTPTLISENFLPWLLLIFTLHYFKHSLKLGFISGSALGYWGSVCLILPQRYALLLAGALSYIFNMW